MPTIYIDGVSYHAEKGQTIIEIADGINTKGVEQTDVPRFCYHPSLSVAGNCRMCLVEIGALKVDRDTGESMLNERGEPLIEWSPKLATACSTQVVDGMRIRTHHQSNLVKDAQKGILEFILINHPLDCPTCDQAGECPLQQITYKYGPQGSRFEFEKVSKPKRVKWGSKIVFDAERCINCTRCVRFFDEYTKTNELEIVQRGWNNYPDPALESDLDKNDYAMNIIDLCPVGALTSADYRFKARVWEMSETNTISVNNAYGASIKLWVKDNLVVRVTPRYNPLVNGYFMQDSDRLNYRWINENRASGPKEKYNQSHKSISWDMAIKAASKKLKTYKGEEIFVLASSRASLESLYLLKKFADEVLKTPHIDFKRYLVGKDDKLLNKADKTPNSLGCKLLDIFPQDNINTQTLGDAISRKVIKCVIAMEDDLLNVITPTQLASLDTFIVLPYHNLESSKHANVILPVATFAESVGTYVNFLGVVQRTRPAKMLRYQNRSLMRETMISRLDRHATQFDKWNSIKNKVDAMPSWKIVANMLENFEFESRFSSASSIFDDIAKNVDEFQGLSYEKLGQYGIKLDTVKQEISI